jgi:hypothetical protein
MGYIPGFSENSIPDVTGGDFMLPPHWGDRGGGFAGAMSISTGITRDAFRWRLVQHRDRCKSLLLIAPDLY